MNVKFIFILFLMSLSCPSVIGQLYINEWMASNSSVISDPDYDETGDWIELFNDYNDPIDISGYYLTDKSGEPTKWTFPSGTLIGPNNYLLIWADGKNEGIHTSFKLTKEGEEIGLYAPDNTQIDHISFKNQKTNVSMGRINDGSSNLGFFLEPTPGYSNSTKAYSDITFYLPNFSIKGGIYSQPLTIELKTIAGDIRFTKDGSLPTTDSELYMDPISVEQTTVLRASVFIENQISGKPVTHTYLFEPAIRERNLPIISISSNPEYFWDDSIGLYVQDFKPSWEYPINIELFENDGSDRAAFNELAGTKINGLNSWVLPQKMLGIYFDNDYDKNNLEYQLFFDNDRKRFDNFVLRASGSDWGNTLFRDALSQGLTSQNMNIEKMGFRPSIVYINGAYMGIHNMRSRIDEGFIEENFGYASSEYDLIENNGTVEEGDNIAFYELFTLLDKDLSAPSNYEAVASLVDIENLMDYFITEIWSSNSSWGHNIQMWKPKTEGAKWRWILQDLDRGFTGTDDGLISQFTTSTVPSGYNWARIPLNSLIQNEGFRHQFAQRFTDHLFTTFHPERVNSFIEKHKDLIDQEIPYHVERWAGTTSSYGNGLPSFAHWEGEVAKLTSFANGRPPVLIEDIKNSFGLDDAVALTLITNPGNAGFVTINTLPISGSPWQGQYFKNMPFQLAAIPEVGQHFLGWSVAKFEPLIAKGSEWKYLDDGSDQGAAWKEINFDDTSWSVGVAKFGYGDNNEDTTISFGEDANDKYITTYFRKEITLENVNAYTDTLSIELLRDDGAIVYINGMEVIRSNLPKGDVDYKTLASTFAGGEEEIIFFKYLIEDGILVDGKNTIAVEIHQNLPNSSDLGFDFSMKALKFSNNAYISTEEKVDITLNSDSIFVANYTPSEICTLPRRISSNTTLDLSCSPYYAIADVVVDSNITLTIEEGVHIYFREDKNFEIRGNLVINGSEDAPVIITAQDEEKPWGGLLFKHTSSQSSLHFLEISKASHGKHPIYENAAISAFYASIDMDHVLIEDVESNPILAYYSDIILRNSSLHSKVTGDLINVKYGRCEVYNSYFSGNDQIDTDAIDFDGVENGKIVENKIFNFLGYNSDGIDIGEETNDVLVEGNFIHNCTDKGISIGQASSLHAVHNVIVNCDKGIAIKDQSTANIDQNTFYNVGTPVACFEKNIGLGGGFGLITNSILSNSSRAPIEYDSVSQLEITTSLSDTDSLPETLNFFGNPLFENPSFNDFTLQSGSIAINSGTDQNGMKVDLGARPNPYFTDPSLMITSIQYFPKENQDAEFITLFNASEQTIDLEGYMLTDAIDFIFPSGASIEANETILIALDELLVSQDVNQQYTWTRGRLSNEGENINLMAPSGIIVDHVNYDNKSPWPLEAEGNGSFLQLIDPGLDNHFAESWESKLNTAVDNPYYSKKTITLYPNPANDIISILSKEEIIKSVEIFDILGQIVSETKWNTKIVSVNVQNLKSGTYIIRINGNINPNRLVIHN